MAKKGDMIIVGADCEDCKYLENNENNKNNKVICKAKNKTYFYGQYVQCDNKEKVNK